MRLVIAEKPSVAKAIAPVVGARTRKDGYFEGNRALASFVKKNSLISKNFDELLENSTSNMFTRSRVKRFILFSYFEVSKEIDAYHIESVNLLAANLKGREFLSSVRKDADIKVKTKSFKRKNKVWMPVHGEPQNQCIYCNLCKLLCYKCPYSITVVSHPDSYYGSSYSSYECGKKEFTELECF